MSTRTIGNYVLGPLIGRGGTGEVYEAQLRDGGSLDVSPLANRKNNVLTDSPEGVSGGGPGARGRASHTVAIKLLRSHLASDPAAIAAFRAEAERTRAISHPNVVRVIDFDCDRDGFYLVMDRLAGETLAARIARGPVDEPTARRLGAAIADGLAAAHARGIVHRDLKPGNVVLVGDEPVIVDFGIARYFAGDAPAVTSTRIGTPAYMAPEQLTGGVIAPCVDVWALGAVLYEMVTGAVPFDARDGNCPQLVEPAPRLREVSPGYAALVGACLERDPGRRPARIEDVARRLREADGERITEDVGPLVAPRPATPPAPRRSRRRAPIAIAAASALVIGGVGAWLLAGSSRPASPTAVQSAPAMPVPTAASQADATPTPEPPATQPSHVPAAPPPRPAIKRPPAHVTKRPPATKRAGETLD